MGRSLAVAGVLLAALWTATGSAGAGIDAGLLSGAKMAVEHLDPGGENNVAGSVRCPRGTRVVSGGAFWHEPGEPPKTEYDGSLPAMSGSGPIARGRGWYAQGRGIGGQDLRLTLKARCLGKGLLAGYVMRKREIEPPDGGPGGARVACPGRKRTISGGAIWHPKGAAPNAEDADKGLLASSTPSRRGWYADGADNFLAPPVMVLRVLVLCLPRRELADTTLRKRTVTSVPDDEAASRRVRCKRASQRVLAGGAFWHPPSGMPPPEGNSGIFGGSSGFLGGRSWFASGLNFHAGGLDEPRSLTVSALCLKRP